MTFLAILLGILLIATSAAWHHSVEKWSALAYGYKALLEGTTIELAGERHRAEVERLAAFRRQPQDWLERYFNETDEERLARWAAEQGKTWPPVSTKTEVDKLHPTRFERDPI